MTTLAVCIAVVSPIERAGCARIGAILVDLQHCGRQLRRIAQRLIGTRQAQGRAPSMPGIEERAVHRIEVSGECRSGARMGAGRAVREAQREDAVVPARLSGDGDRAVACRLEL